MMNAIFRRATLALATAPVAASLFLHYQWLKESHQANTVVEMRELRQARQADFDNCARMLAAYPHSSSGLSSGYPFLPDLYWTVWKQCDNDRKVAGGGSTMRESTLSRRLTNVGERIHTLPPAPTRAITPHDNSSSVACWAPLCYHSPSKCPLRGHKTRTIVI